MPRYTNIIINYFSNVKTVGGDAFLIKKLHHFHNNARFCIFEHFTNLCLCHIFVTNANFVTIPEFENNQEFKPNQNFLIIEY